jgi:hypothetical protein
MKTIWFCWLFSVYISLVSVVGLKLFDCVELSRCISAPCQLFALSYLILLQFSVYISPMSAVGLKLFDCVDFSLCISAPCQLLVWNYLTLLSFLSIYQPRVSCWFKTSWMCWVFSVYINSVSAVGLKLFDFVVFSQCISTPCQLLVWNYLILLTFLRVYISPVSAVGMKLFDFVEYVSFVYICCLYETIWFCWLFSVYISAPCQLLSVVGLKLFYFVEFSQYISALCQLLMIIILRSYMFRNKKILCYICKS